MEQLTLKKMREIIGWPEGEGDGIFSPGKSRTRNGNKTGLGANIVIKSNNKKYILLAML